MDVLAVGAVFVGSVFVAVAGAHGVLSLVLYLMTHPAARSTTRAA